MSNYDEPGDFPSGAASGEHLGDCLSRESSPRAWPGVAGQCFGRCRRAKSLLAGLALVFFEAPELQADSWARPCAATNSSENGVYQLVVVPHILASRGTQGPTAIFWHQANGRTKKLWQRKLANTVAPVEILVSDSGRYVVTLDEWHRVGTLPVVVYGDKGLLIARLSLQDLQLNHSAIRQTISSYWWNEAAMYFFGPKSSSTSPEAQMLEDTLFIRLYWGQIIEIDLASGKVRDEVWRAALKPEAATRLKEAADTYLQQAWERLFAQHFREENFFPKATRAGLQGVLLADQLRKTEAVPLLRKIAGTQKFRTVSAPVMKPGEPGNLCTLAEQALQKIEFRMKGVQANPDGSAETSK